MSQLCHLCLELEQSEEAFGQKQVTSVTSLAQLASSTTDCQGICSFVRKTAMHFFNTEAQQKATRLIVFSEGISLPLEIDGRDDNTGLHFSLELYTDRNAPMWPFRLIHEGVSIKGRSDDPHVLSQCRSWLDSCKSLHAACSHTRVANSCFVRMLDCRAGLLRLVENFDATNNRFAALSYCWGDAKHIVTDTSLLPAHLHNTPRSSLPPTFSQAIEVCEYLDIHYLWIDALCIIQDDASDWNAESRKMGSVYELAELVLSANGAPSSSDGLFFDRVQAIPVGVSSSSGTGATRSLWGRPKIEHVHLNFDHHVPKGSKAPLFLRAWALQEWLLARRVLHFGKQEVIWECRDALECECGRVRGRTPVPGTAAPFMSRRQQLRNSIVGMIANPDDWPCHKAIRLWTNILEEYTIRGLTKYTDRLIAINAIADVISAACQPSQIGQYASGIFCCYASNSMLLALQLLWYTWAPRGNRRCERSTKRVAPTWSWAAVEERVNWNMNLWAPYEAQIKVTAEMAFTSRFQLPHIDQTGAYVNDTLRLKARAVVLELHQTSSPDLCRGQLQPPKRTEAGDTPQVMKANLIRHDIDISHLLKNGPPEVLCVRLLDHTDRGKRFSSCLILRESISAGTSVPVYERIGMDDEVPPDWFHGAAPMELFVI